MLRIKLCLVNQCFYYWSYHFITRQIISFGFLLKMDLYINDCKKNMLHIQVSKQQFNSLEEKIPSRREIILQNLDEKFGLWNSASKRNLFLQCQAYNNTTWKICCHSNFHKAHIHLLLRFQSTHPTKSATLKKCWWYHRLCKRENQILFTALQSLKTWKGDSQAHLQILQIGSGCTPLSNRKEAVFNPRYHTCKIKKLYCMGPFPFHTFSRSTSSAANAEA